MDKETLIGFCRYYKGETSAPKGVNAMFWEYEQKWVQDTLEVFGDTKQDQDHACFAYLNEYVQAGLGQYRCDDDVPTTLKALLFNRYEHWTQGNADGFKEWYEKLYLNQSKG